MIQQVLGNVGLNNPNPAALPMIGGVAKIFVAEMVEKGDSSAFPNTLVRSIN